MSENKFEIGNRIKEIRIRKNVSVVELAYRTNSSESHLYKIENGHKGMSIDLLAKIIDSLDMDANELFGKDIDETSIDAALDRLEPEIKNKLSDLFMTMIDQAEATNK